MRKPFNNEFLQIAIKLHKSNQIYTGYLRKSLQPK